MSEFFIVILLIFSIPYVVSLILAPFYFKFGFGKCFYHDILKWHIPKEKEKALLTVAAYIIIVNFAIKK